jgi:hypothetical protein
MEHPTFTDHLERATSAALQYARRFVTNRLPDEGRYLVGSDVCDAAGVIERLWRCGEVPVWIDIAVDSADDRFTYFRLHYSRRTRARAEGLRYRSEGYPPLQCLGPVLPSGWKDLESSGRFDIHWRARPSLV